MPSIPQYVSRERMTTEAPTIKKDASFEAEASVGGALSDAAKIVAEVKVKFDELNDFNQTNDARITAKQREYEAEDSISNNPDLNSAAGDITKYQDKIRQEAAQKISNPIARQKFLANYDLQSLAWAHDMNNKVRLRQIDKGVAMANTEFDLLSSEYANAPDAASKAAVRKKMDDRSAEYVQRGLFKATEGQELTTKAIEKAEGYVKDRASLAKFKQAKFEKAAEEAMDAREVEIMQMLRTHKQKQGDTEVAVTNEEIIKMVRDDANAEIPRIGQSFADRVISAATSPKAVNAKTIDKDFADIISDINAGIRTPEKIRSNILKAVEDGYISEDDFAILTTYYDMVTTKQVDDLVAQDVRKSWRGIEIFTENTTNKEASRSRISRIFINRMQSGIDAESAALEATRSEVLFLHPEAKNNPEGIIVMDSAGVTKRIMPNGDLLPVETKTQSSKGK